MTGQNGTSPTFAFSVIPLDCCRRCQRYDGERSGLGMPVAISVQRDHSWIVRYTCPSCRLLWDCAWQVSGDRSYGPFADGFIRYAAEIESHPKDGSFFPAGPRHLLEQNPA